MCRIISGERLIFVAAYRVWRKTSDGINGEGDLSCGLSFIVTNYDSGCLIMPSTSVGVWEKIGSKIDSTAIDSGWQSAQSLALSISRDRFEVLQAANLIRPIFGEYNPFFFKALQITSSSA